MAKNAKIEKFMRHFWVIFKHCGKVAKNSSIAYILAADDHPSMHQGRRPQDEKRAFDHQVYQNVKGKSIR